ncbi:Helix-turn-helix domain-containing protein [Atopomonas hussainii]|uniref:Helix-turn-helix domain-containing protein n=1 Tax=Atopomonas hussainii TaxID=1429083 RepID=A0A1H7FP13_9GAMM|nr:helix-turn-helix domain-containing protein [Atopomonas hussainii]SEK25115.1 Helix-turn-helix domain-containing protein [Atopomonas hussainii]
MNLPPPAVQLALPAAPLRPYISHYWLGLDNRDDTFAISPDGAVDVVLVIGPGDYRLRAFGTTTHCTEVPLERAQHYLGIRFRAGQSRHFLAAKALELTNTVQPADDAFAVNFNWLAADLPAATLFAQLDSTLVHYLLRHPAVPSRLDAVVRYVEQTPGPLTVSELAALYCKSRRQFERAFRDTVGLSPKLFAAILRFRRAAALLVGSPLPIAQIAARLGYVDQSHLSHDCVRFAGLPPARARTDAAFLQDPSYRAPHPSDSTYLDEGVLR